MPQPRLISRLGAQYDLRRRYRQTGPAVVDTTGSVYGGRGENQPFAYGRKGETTANTRTKNFAAFPKAAFDRGLVTPNVPVTAINPATGLRTTVIPKDIGLPAVRSTGGTDTATRGIDLSPAAAAAIKYPGSGPLQLNLTPPGYTTPQYPKAQPIAYAPGEPGQPVGGKYYGPTALGPAGYSFQSNIPTGAPYSASPGIYGAPAAPNSIGPSQSLGTVSALYNPPDPFKFDIQTGLSYGDPFGFNTSGDFGGYDLGSNPYDLYPGQTPAGITIPPLGVNDVPQSDLMASSQNFGGGVMSTDNPETQIPSIEINAGGPDASQQQPQDTFTQNPSVPDVTAPNPYSTSTPIDVNYGSNTPLIPIYNYGVPTSGGPSYAGGFPGYGGGSFAAGFAGPGFAAGTGIAGTGGFGTSFGSLGFGAFGGGGISPKLF